MMNEAVKYTKQALREKSDIHINPENKGKFTATKQRTGKSTEELTHSKNPLTRKRAVFAQNAKKWNKKGVNEEEQPNQFQQKPNWEEILQRINDAGVNQAMPKQPKKTQPSPSFNYTFQIGDYTFNSAQHRLDGPNGTEYIRGRYSDMLTVFCENINQTIPTTMLLKTFYGVTDDSDEMVIKKAISNLRFDMNGFKKLFEADPNIRFYSVRGEGYRMEVQTGVQESKLNKNRTIYNLF